MTIIKCKNCGADMAGDAVFCGLCGTTIETPASDSADSLDKTFVFKAPNKNPAVPNAQVNVLNTPNKCKNCNAEMAEGVSFCGLCGTTMESADAAPDNNAPPNTFNTQFSPPGSSSAPAYDDNVFETYGNETNQKKPIKMADVGKKITSTLKKYTKHAIIAVSAMAVIITAIIILMPSNFDNTRGYINIIPQSEHGIVTIIPHGRDKVDIEGHYRSSARSLDGTKAVVMVQDGVSEGNALYLVTNRVQLISDEVSNFWFSASGDGIAYTIFEPDNHDSSSWDWDREWQRSWNRTAELWHYIDGNARRLTSDFFVNGSCTLSPDGKIVAYTTVSGSVENDNIRYTGIVWDGKANELGRDVYPVAVSNGARYIYFNRTTNDNRVMHVQRGFNENNRERLGENISTLIFNRDLSQAVFTSNSRSFISARGSERVALSGVVHWFILPNGTGSFSSNGVIIHGIRNFSNSFYQNRDGAIVRINNNNEAESIVRNVESAFLATDGKTLTYLRNGSIFKLNGLARDAEPERLADRDVRFFLATNNSSAVFFVDTDNDIFYQRGNNRATSVSNDFRWGGLNLSLFKGDTLYYISDNELFSSSGARGRRVSGLEGDVTSVVATMFDMIVRTNDGGETLIYHSTDGQRFKQVGSIPSRSDSWGWDAVVPDDYWW